VKTPNFGIGIQWRAHGQKLGVFTHLQTPSFGAILKT
jgi:hypothetical protein